MYRIILKKVCACIKNMSSIKYPPWVFSKFSLIFYYLKFTYVQPDMLNIDLVAVSQTVSPSVCLPVSVSHYGVSPSRFGSAVTLLSRFGRTARPNSLAESSAETGVRSGWMSKRQWKNAQNNFDGNILLSGVICWWNYAQWWLARIKTPNEINLKWYLSVVF